MLRICDVGAARKVVEFPWAYGVPMELPTLSVVGAAPKVATDVCETTKGVPLLTFMRALPRKNPPPQPAGIDQCDEAAIVLWRQDEMRFPPYHYLQKNLCCDVDGQVFPPTIT